MWRAFEKRLRNLGYSGPKLFQVEVATFSKCWFFNRFAIKFAICDRLCVLLKFQIHLIGFIFFMNFQIGISFQLWIAASYIYVSIKTTCVRCIEAMTKQFNWTIPFKALQYSILCIGLYRYGLLFYRTAFCRRLFTDWNAIMWKIYIITSCFAHQIHRYFCNVMFLCYCGSAARYSNHVANADY